MLPLGAWCPSGKGKVGKEDGHQVNGCIPTAHYCHSLNPVFTAEFIIIDPLDGRRGINGLSHTRAAGVLLSANYTIMLAPYNRVNVYDPRYRRVLGKPCASS